MEEKKKEMAEPKSREEVLAILEKWKESGLSARVYAAREGYALATFYPWSQKSRRWDEENKGKAFTELGIRAVTEQENGLSS